MTREEALAILRKENGVVYSEYEEAVDVIERALADRPHGKWVSLEYVDEEKATHTNFPYELDGNWVLVTDGKSISIERIKKDIPDDHFSPAGRWFELNDVVAWMPLPDPPKGGDS